MRLFEPLNNVIQEYLPEDKIDLVKRAFVIARDAHEGQFRSSGEPYITHPVAVAGIIAEMRLDHEAVMAALLHDVIEDTPYTEQQLTDEFGKSVAEIVEGVSKLDKLKFRTRQEAQAESFRKMILAMTKDIRVVLIKLADRTHNMRTLGALRPDKRRRIAKETLEIYCPIAHRLGIEHLKNELEDLCFQAMHPFRYGILQAAMQSARTKYQEMIQPVIDEVQAKLNQRHINARVFGLEKPLYYIYQNLRLREQQFHSIMDIYDFRVIVENVDHCYLALGVLHSLYKPRPGKIKDHIAVPKANGYQALHTSMIGPKGVSVEVQIRTEEMNLIAEMGITAHWMYKPEGKNDSTTAQIKAQNWLQSIIELQQSAGNSFEFIESVKSDLFSDEIYVFTPKGRIVELPKGATAVDFAYAVHTKIGDTCIGAKVDREAYPLSQPLRSGQTVDILTSPNSHPNENWLNFVVTGRARSKIRHTLKGLQQQEAIELGRQQLNYALGQQPIDDLNEQQINRVLTEFSLTSFEQLLAEIGLGNQLSTVIAQRLLGEHTALAMTDESQAQKPLLIKGIDGFLINFAQCCHPVPGDPILAYTMPGKGLMIHHENCANLRHQLENHKSLAVQWAEMVSSEEFEAELNVIMTSAQGALSNLMQAISAAQSHIRSIWTEEDETHLFQAILLVSVKNTKHLTQIINKIQSINDVISVERNINA